MWDEQRDFLIAGVPRLKKVDVSVIQAVATDGMITNLTRLPN